MKKLFVLFIVAFICACGISVCADELCADVVFCDTGIEAHNMSAVSGRNIRYTNSERNGVKGWYISDLNDNNWIDFKYNDGSLHIGGNYRLDVTYFDEKSGYFTLMYNSVSGVKTTEHIWHTGSNEWKTYSIYMYDARFNQSAFGSYDFRITMYDELYSPSEYGTLIHKVELYSLNTETVITPKMKTSGNNLVFFKGEDVKLDFILSNRSSAFSGEIEYEITDDAGRVVLRDCSRMNFLSGNNDYSIRFQPERYGIFNLRLKCKGENTESLDEFEFAVINTDFGESVNPEFGVTAHIGYVSRNYDVDLHTSYMKNSGIGFVRDQIKWNDYEKAEGKYELLQNHRDELLSLKEKGLEPLIIIGGSNPLYIDRYGSDRDDFPMTPDELAAFYDYVYNLVNDTKDYVTYYEIWNEYNLSDMTTAEYVEILKTAYSAAKRANPDCRIVGMALASSNPIKALEDAKKLGAFDYLDIVSTHYYSIDEKRVMPEYSYLNSELQQIRELCEDKPLWLTEIGWATNYKWLKDEDAAAYLVRTVLLNDSKNYVDKIFWYDWHDDGEQKMNKEHNFGLLKKDYSAKRVYASLSNTNINLSNAEFEDLSTYDDIYAYTYDNEKGSKMYVVYSRDNSAKNITVYSSSEVKVYDMYGNLEKVCQDEKWNLLIDGKPIYLFPESGEVYFDFELAKVDFEENNSKGIVAEGTLPEDCSVKVDVTSVENLENYENFQLDVTYFDGNEGVFTIFYDSVDGVKCLETVYLSGTNQYLTHSFFMQGASFSNSIEDKYDFVITTPNENGESSSNGAEIANFVLRNDKTSSYIKIDADDTLLFNNGYNKIPVKFKNLTNERLELTAKYTVKDRFNNIIGQYAENFVVDENEEIYNFIKVNLSKYGSFSLIIEVFNEEKGICSRGNAVVTICENRLIKYKNELSGISSSISNTELIRNSGAKNIIYKLNWNDIPTNISELEVYVSEGYRVIIEICFNNETYPINHNLLSECISNLGKTLKNISETYIIRQGDMSDDEYESVLKCVKRSFEESGISAKIIANISFEDSDYIDGVYANDTEITGDYKSDKPLYIFCSNVNTEETLKIMLKNIGTIIFDGSNYELYSAISAYNQNLGGSVFKGISPNGSYEYETPDGTTVFAIFSRDKDVITIDSFSGGIVLKDMFGNEKESYLFNTEYEIETGPEPVYIMLDKTGVWYDYSVNTAYVKDFTDAGINGEKVNITVYSSGESMDIVYINQVRTGENGLFSFDFGVNDEGEYIAVVSDRYGMKRQYMFEISRKVNASITIEDENGNSYTRLHSMKESGNDAFWGVGKIENEHNADKECMFIIGGYKDDVLNFCKTVKGSIDNVFLKRFELEISKEIIETLDYFKIFMWDESNFSPLTETLYLQ